MPFSGFDDFDDCLQTMTEEEGHDMDSAENICGALQAEEKSEHGNVEELREALERGAGLIADVGVDLVSGVDVPAVDSKWVMTKDADGHDWRANSPILLSKADDEDQRISYAAAMIPRETDKEGDVVATPTVEKAAHDFLKSDGGVDTDHSLIDGEGEVVESWVLKQERTFDLPRGETETYGAGTWMVGIEWGRDAWKRIEDGELTGLSIYGMAEHVPLERSACGCSATAKQLDIPLANEAVVHLVYESRTAAEKASEDIGLDGAVHGHEFDGMDVWMPGETHDEFVERYMELSEENSEETEAAAKQDDPCWEGYTMVGTDENGNPRCVPDDDIDDVEFDSAEILTDANRQSGATPKSADGQRGDMAPDNSGNGGDADAGDDSTADGDGPDIGELAASVESLAETVESVKDAVETDKQDDRDAAEAIAEGVDGMGAGDVLDLVDAAAGMDPAAAKEAIEQAAKADDGDDEEEEEDEMEASTEKRLNDANTSKGSDARQTAAKGIEDGESPTGGVPSYLEAAAQED